MGLLGGLGNALGFGSDAGAYEAQMMQLAGQVDPFSQYRPQMAADLNQLMENPEQYLRSDPGYLWGISQGEQGLLRQKAAIGGAGSGGEKIALQQYDQSFASNYYQNALQNLARLSNAYQGPGEVAQIGSAAITGAEEMKMQQGSNLLGTIGTIGGGIAGFMFGGPAGAMAGASIGSRL